jgi:hypothetical protein
MFVRAVVQQAVATDAVLAPQAGVQRGAGGVAQAWVIDAAGKAQQKSVELAEAIGTNWRVLSGLSAGDRLVVEGTGKLRAGQLVHAVAVADGQGTDGAAPAAGSAAQADAPTPAAQGTTPAAGQPKATGATATRQVAEGPATVTRR